MPWQERTPMERRRQFIEDWLTELWTMSELCAAYDVSRKTGYQLLKRFGAEGWAAVVERSRRPHRTPPPIPAEVVARVLMLRERHPRWGARKLRGRLLRREPTVAWPSQTAIHRLLHQAALVGDQRMGGQRPCQEPDRLLDLPQAALGEPTPVQRVSSEQVVPQSAGCPDPELGSPLGVDSIADR